MCCSLTCPDCRRGTVPELILERARAIGILDGGPSSEEALMATCAHCKAVFPAMAQVTHRGEIQYFTEIKGAPLIRAPCPRCRCIVGAAVQPLMRLPPTGGDYEWIEIEAEIICPVCEYSWEDRIRVELETRQSSVIPHPIEGPRWERAFVAAKVTYSRGERDGLEEVYASTQWKEVLAWCEQHPDLFRHLHRPGSYEYVQLERRGTQYYDKDGDRFY